MLKKIKKLEVDASATIEIVKNEQGHELVLKTSDPYEVNVERKFIEILKEHNIPHLELYEDETLLPNQLLLEYVEDSPTIGKDELPKWFIKWGEIIRKIHDVKSPEAIKVLEDNSVQSVSWNNFIKERYQTAVSKHVEVGLLDTGTMEKIGKLVERLQSTEISTYSLIHGDLHSNNAMIRNEEVILFDKGSSILYGDMLYDLAVPIINFSFTNEEKDKENIEAFMQGYGESFLETNIERLDYYVLLRAFERHGNKFEPQTGDIMFRLLSKYL